MTTVWIVLFIAFALIEAGTVQLVSIWFAFGALCALVAESVGGNLYVQITVFTVVSALLLPFTRPLAKKLLSKREGKTDLDRILDSHVKITVTVDNDENSGECVINGVTWSVRSNDSSVIKKGENAVVKRIEGVKLYVQKL